MLQVDGYHHQLSGSSSVRLEHYIWDVGVVGSNPAYPTKNNNLEDYPSW